MDATTFFLTYSQYSCTHQELYDHLHSIKPIVWARVATELHENQLDEHMHVIVKFGARVRTRTNIRIFDHAGHHPNIQVVRNVQHVLEYVSKDGNFTDYGEIPTAKAKADYESLVQAAASGDRTSFDKLAFENRVQFQWAQHIWNVNSQPGQFTILEPSGGTMCLQLQQLQFTGGSIAIIGPAGCGKTTWATTVAPKPALWVTHIDDLKKLTKMHKSIIFDDMDFSHWPRTTQISIVDQERTRSIHVRYGTTVIPAWTPKIFTGNQPMFTHDEAINRRIQLVTIYSYTL